MAEDAATAALSALPARQDASRVHDRIRLESTVVASSCRTCSRELPDRSDPRCPMTFKCPFAIRLQIPLRLTVVVFSVWCDNRQDRAHVTNSNIDKSCQDFFARAAHEATIATRRPVLRSPRKVYVPIWQHSRHSLCRRVTSPSVPYPVAIEYYPPADMNSDPDM